MMHEREPIRLGIVGATGQVGNHMLEILRERDFPIGNLHLYASERSAGRQLDFGINRFTIENAATADFEGRDIVLFSAGASVSMELAPRAAAAGAIVIDNSSAFRSDPEVPLVVAGVNDFALRNIPKNIISNPNCTTMTAMPVLKALHEHASITEMVISTFQAVSGAGYAGVHELTDQLIEATSDITTKVFPKQIAHNVIPMRGNLVGRDTDEELKLLNETKKILGIADLAVSATCVSVPVFVGHSLSIEARFKDPISPDEAEDILMAANEVKLVGTPTPLDAEGGNDTLVGRIRQSGISWGGHGLSFFVSGDNLRKGAALNAVQIAEFIVRNNLLRRS